MNVTKWKFFQTTIDYLDREISENRVHPGLQKINAVVKAPDPTDIKELRYFLGLVNYFRKFIKGFAKIVASLTELLRKDKHSTGTETHSHSQTNTSSL